MTPLLFNAGSPILSIVPPIRSNRSSWSIVTGKRDRLQPVRPGEEDAFGRPPAGDVRAERHMPGTVQRRQRMRPEPRERAAPRQVVPEGRHLHHMPGFGEEDAIACRRMQHSRVEGDLTARVDRRDNWLRGDIEPIEAAAAGRRQTRPDNSAQCAGFGHRNGRRLRRHTSRWLRRCR